MGKHKNANQDEIILGFMRDNPDLARGFSKGDRIAIDGKWSKLAVDLNAAGPPIKDTAGWKKVWSDWKIIVRKKLARNKQEVKSTGGGPYSQVVIQPIEEEIARLCGLCTMVEGTGAMVFGAPNCNDLPHIKDEATPVTKKMLIAPDKRQLDLTEDMLPISESEPLLLLSENVIQEPKPKKCRTMNAPQNLDDLCATQAETMKLIANNLQSMLTQQKQHFQNVEDVEREKLDVLKSIAKKINL